jgi:3-isopropylmalate/(R)-2-methylmalate dehydratase small subunit
VDTDLIIPGKYCKRISRTGYEDALFANWRREEDHVIDRPEYSGASIMVTGANFGIGSSREHAVWALADHGFRVVAAPSFSDIFHGNAVNNGLLPAVISDSAVKVLWDTVEKSPTSVITVDLERCSIAVAGQEFGFQITALARDRILRGIDPVAATLGYEADIAAFEANRTALYPSTARTPACGGTMSS